MQITNKSFKNLSKLEYLGTTATELKLDHFEDIEKVAG